MSFSIDRTPFPGQDPTISESKTAQSRPKLNEVMQRLQEARQKIMDKEILLDDIPGTPNATSDIPIATSEQLQQTADIHIQSRLAIMWSKTGSKAGEAIKGAFISAMNHLKIAFKGVKEAATPFMSSKKVLDAKEAATPFMSGKKVLDAKDLKPVIDALEVPLHKNALRSLIMEKQGQPEGSIEIHFEEPIEIKKLKSEHIRLPVEGSNFVTVSYSSKPYGANDEKDRGVILIAGDQKPGGVVSLFAQEEVENEKHPVLTALAKNKEMGEMRKGDVRVGGQSRGAFLKRIPKQCDINPFKEFTYEVGDQSYSAKPIYGMEFGKTYREYLKNMQKSNSPEVAKQFVEMLIEKGVIEIYKEPKLESILYMVAPRASSVNITPEQGYDLLNAIALPYIAALKEGATTLPFGPVGTGAFGNNYQFSLLTGLLAAEYARGQTGKSMELVYHDPGTLGSSRVAVYQETVAYFDSTIRPMITAGKSIEQIMKTLVNHANENGWKNNPNSVG